jgi:UDP-2,3-diacylglucosamine pyrophosphatase LpxH
MRAIFNLLQNSMQSVASDSASGQSHSHSHSSIQSHSQSPIDPEDDPRNRVRAVFVSDVHLGTQGCQAEALLDFLKHHPSEYLYLVGDIVDGWQLKRRWFWPQAHNDVIQKLLRRVRKGDRVIFVPGNHDEFARAFVGHQFGGVDVQREAIHTTADGKLLWVTHGDDFDGIIQYAKWLAYLGDNAYELTLKLNRHFNTIRRKLGFPYWSLSAYLKDQVKTAVNFISSFEVAVAHEARIRGHYGVVCGHIHRAEMRMIDGTLYCNDGDWVESRSALVEHMDGRLELIHWNYEEGKVSSAKADKPLEIANAPAGVAA